MKTRIANVVSGVGIEPTKANANRPFRKDLQACKPRLTNVARGSATMAVYPKRRVPDA